MMTKTTKKRIDKTVFTAVVSAINMTKDLEVDRKQLKPYVIQALLGLLDTEFFYYFNYINDMIDRILADENLL